MNVLRNFGSIIDKQTLGVTVLAWLSTYVCLELGLVIDLPLELVGIAIVFPIVFSISSAFQRRETALAEFAELKANLTAMFYAHRDWPGLVHDDDAPEIRQITIEVFRCVQDCMKQRSDEAVAQAYTLFSRISESHERLEGSGAAGTDLARLTSQYLNRAMMNFEKMRNIAMYRTPMSLRSYTQVFLNSFPILYGPYFAYVSENSYLVVGFLVATLYSLVLVGLDNIQDALENPYDGIGVDDVHLDIADSYRSLTEQR